VSVAIQIQPQQLLLSIPESAIRPGNVIWILREGKLAVTPIKVAQVIGNQAIIEPGTSGLEAGQQVIVSPLAVAVEGMEVQATKAPQQVASQPQVGK